MDANLVTHLILEQKAVVFDVLTMRCSPAAAVSLAANEAAARDVGKSRGLAIAQCNINVLSLSTLASSNQSCHDAVASIEASCEISDSDANLDGWAVPGAGDVHETKFSLDHDVVSGTAGVRAGLTIAGNGRVDKTGVNFAESLVIHAILFEGAGQIVFDKDVALGDQLVKNVDTILMLE